MKPRVLIIIDTGIIGGPGKGLFQFFRHAPPGEFDFDLANFRYKRPRSRQFIERAQSEGIEVVLFSQRFRFDPAPLWEAARIARSRGCNIVQSHGYKGHLVAAALKRSLGIPWIAMSHGWTTEDWKVRLYHKLDLFLLRWADAVVAVSPQLFATLSELRRGRRTELLMNAVDAGEIGGRGDAASLRERCGFTGGERVIGCFGRLSSEKGQKFLIEAVARLAPDFPGLRLLIAGDGPDRAELEQLARRLGIEGQVQFHGYQSQLGAYYEIIELLAIPSLSEGLPNVLLEAMALGKPVLSTDVGAVREVITHGENGWICPPGDVAALEQQLRRLLDDPRMLARTGSAARDSLFPKFSAKARAERIVQLYRETIGEPAK